MPDDLRAIVIDDEPNSIRTIEFIVNEYCDKVSLVGKANVIEDGEDLIRQLKPDLIFLDINMPRGNGFDLLERFPIRRFNVIIISANLAISDHMVKNYDIDGFIEKPIDIDKLLEIIENIYKKRKNQR
jgi:two-component system LytT family response regulator